MMNKLVSFFAAFAITGLLAFGSHNLSAAEASLDQKLEQCEIAFKTMRSKTSTREEAAKARAKHLSLMIEIIQELNNTNVEAADEDRSLTPKELSDNVRVMGHLLEMLAKDHMAPVQEWSYVY